MRKTLIGYSFVIIWSPLSHQEFNVLLYIYDSHEKSKSSSDKIRNCVLSYVDNN